jgi:hypothetical protein
MVQFNDKGSVSLVGGGRGWGSRLMAGMTYARACLFVQVNFWCMTCTMYYDDSSVIYYI